jgi:hypothetical protein
MVAWRRLIYTRWRWMMQQMLIWLGFVLVVLAAAWFRPNATRLFLGFFFIVMGIGFHLVLILNNPHAYDGFSASAYIPLYRWIFRELVMPYPLAFALAAAAFEIAIGLLMLGKGRNVTIGLSLGGLFLLAITPLGLETLPNALLALGVAYLAMRSFPQSLWELARARLQHNSPPGLG